MESREKRRVRNGDEYTPLFSLPNFRDTTFKKHGSVEDTLNLIRKKVVPETLHQTKQLAKKLKGSDLEATCSNIWHFVYNHITYKKDEDGIEQVRSPARTWWERKSGVDCDCYTVFISSILSNLKIPHKLRVTKYPKMPPEVPAWQHIYVVVPRTGNDYITIDCVKDDFDDEQAYLEKKDYDMRLDYLDGIEEEYVVPQNIDAQDIAANYDEEELGKFGDWLKKTVKNVVVKPITQPIKNTVNFIKDPKKAIKEVPKEAKKIGAEVKEGIRVINRFANPGMLLLRNGFLLAMKVNFLNIAKRLRYGYLTDQQGDGLGMNLDALKKVRQVREKAETIYYQAGGMKENLKKAILKGKGNKDKKVPLNGLSGFDDVYADQDEYMILNTPVNGLGQLGEPVTAASIAAATATLTALAGALSQIKGLFKKGGAEEKEFQSNEDPEAASAITKDYSASSEDEIVDDEFPVTQTSLAPVVRSQVPSAVARIAPPPAQNTINTQNLAPVVNESTSVESSQDKTSWLKDNKGKVLLIAGAVVAGGYLIYKSGKKGRRSGGSLNGLPRKRKARKSQRRVKRKVKSINLKSYGK
jgi:hypothetical protein